ncbi:tetratricopeptide repeat protein, partial [Klebsiella pneumoniae]|uniref:tetratricopeptide repeat protein n=1 Tax=Klebsiella pneumoniae TaxID=573 RepID=UPI0023818545
GVKQNKQTAVEWYRKAADQGDATAQFFLGFAYATGEGVRQDKQTAVEWYRKAADQGYAKAQFLLGVAYA